MYTSFLRPDWNSRPVMYKSPSLTIEQGLPTVLIMSNIGQEMSGYALVVTITFPNFAGKTFALVPPM